METKENRKRRRRADKGEAHDRHHAAKRRARRDAAKARRDPDATETDMHCLYGFHAVRNAMLNPRRVLHGLHVSKNALNRLQCEVSAWPEIAVEICEPRALDRMVGPDAVHQGVVLACDPLPPTPLDEIGTPRLVVALDQITDPHNVGAILRSAVACGAGAVVMTERHSPPETSVLAKSASGALDSIAMVRVVNLADALADLKKRGYHAVGLDSQAMLSIADIRPADRLILVLGSEGKGLRQKTRATCDLLVRLALPGRIQSLNVSNAAAIALYESANRLLAPE